MKPKPPLVYSCSGCSSAAQTANTIAIQLDREKVAEMSCIAGIGGDIRQILNVAKSGRPIIVLDGCMLSCAKSCLRRHKIIPDLHFNLGDLGVKKQMHQDFDEEQAEELKEFIAFKISRLSEN